MLMGDNYTSLRIDSRQLHLPGRNAEIG
jgi:hypothetical protein